MRCVEERAGQVIALPAVQGYSDAGSSGGVS
jgi:hypothetical protein